MELSLTAIQQALPDLKYHKNLRHTCYETVTSIDHVDEPISYEEFFNKYLMPNRACILGRWATDGWQSRKDWVMSNGQPDWSFIDHHFGAAQASVANCKEQQYGAHPKQEMTVSEFIQYAREYKSSGYDPHKPCWYLKDWHFVKAFPDYKAYTTPVFFQSDWMNEWWDERSDCEDDYRFVYMGPKGSWTPFHADVFRSFSWSANICGRKKWIMLVPGEECHLKDKHGELLFDLESPAARDASRLARQFEVIQEEGEVIFVPSGWHHQVFNLEDTISINHNWLNGASVDLCWSHIKQRHLAVKQEIQDCRDMDGWADQCQLILKADSGINYAEFYSFMLSIAERRFQSLEPHLQVAMTAPRIPNERNPAQDSSCGQCSSDAQNAEMEPISCRGHAEAPSCLERCESRLTSSSAPASCSGDVTSERLKNTEKLENTPNIVAPEAKRVCCCGAVSTSGSSHHVVFDLSRVRTVVQDMVELKEFQLLDMSQFSVEPRQLVRSIEALLSATGLC